MHHLKRIFQVGQGHRHLRARWGAGPARQLGGVGLGAGGFPVKAFFGSRDPNHPKFEL